MDVGWLSPWTSRPSSASGGDHRRRRAPTVADPLGDGRRASLGLPGGGSAGGRGRSPTPGSRLRAHPPVSEPSDGPRSEEHTSELQSRLHLVCRLLLEKKKRKQ